VLAHRIDLLGSGLTELGDEIDWHLDFKSGYRWPRDFYQDMVPTRLDDSSDAKVPWELSRGHHLLTLARAARLFEDERYATELERQLGSWLDENPTGYGINWVNPMEVALRAVNWIWAIGTLELLRPLDAELRSQIATSLQAHARHIGANLEGTPQLRSNHYLSDILGLLVIGACVDGDKGVDRLFSRAHKAFEREILTQVHADGVDFEASLPYHGLVLEIFLVASFVATCSGRPFSPGYEKRLSTMLSASRNLRQPDGRVPQIGDGDSGRVLPAGFAREATFDHLLWLGAAILKQGRPLDGPPQEEVAWTLGLDAWSRLQAAPIEGEEVSRQYPRGGFFVMRGGRSHVVARCGDVGQNGNGGHSHNDLLSFELWHGAPFVVDPGTYVYTSDPTERNRFRSTRSHNTISVDGAEINPIVESDLFRLPQFARPSVELFEIDSERVCLIARHDGFRRRDPPVLHRRQFSLEVPTGALEVVDELLGEGEQRAESFLHLASGVRVERTETEDLVLINGMQSLTLSCHGASSVDVEEGWVSEQFGVRQGAPVIVARAQGQMPLRLSWHFTPHEEIDSQTDLDARQAALR
jgi:hypothetical protein